MSKNKYKWKKDQGYIINFRDVKNEALIQKIGEEVLQIQEIINEERKVIF